MPSGSSALLLMTMPSGSSALLFTARPYHQAAATARVHTHPQLQFGEFLKGIEEAKKEATRTLESLKGSQGELQDDGETDQEKKSRAGRKEQMRKDEAAAEDDVPTKLFKFFIGEPEEGNVQGIARTASAPDTYPATKTEFAAPVEGDSAAITHLRPLLKNTNLEFLALRKAYDAGRDGWSAEAFHSKVDRTGPCLVVCETEGGALCGGYAPKGYAGYGEYRGSIAAFLYTWPDGDVSSPVIKLQKVGGAGLATIDEPETGPRFGMDGLVIRMDPGKDTVRRAVSKLGPFYEPIAGVGAKRSRSIFADSEVDSVPSVAQLTTLQVYVGVWPEGQRIPFDGAIPFAIE